MGISDMSAGAHGDVRVPGTGVTGSCHLTWVLETELKFFARVVCFFNCWALFPASWAVKDITD